MKPPKTLGKNEPYNPDSGVEGYKNFKDKRIDRYHAVLIGILSFLILYIIAVVNSL